MIYTPYSTALISPLHGSVSLWLTLVLFLPTPSQLLGAMIPQSSAHMLPTALEAFLSQPMEFS